MDVEDDADCGTIYARVQASTNDDDDPCNAEPRCAYFNPRTRLLSLIDTSPSANFRTTTELLVGWLFVASETRNTSNLLSVVLKGIPFGDGDTEIADFFQMAAENREGTRLEFSDAQTFHQWVRVVRDSVAEAVVQKHSNENLRCYSLSNGLPAIDPRFNLKFAVVPPEYQGCFYPELDRTAFYFFAPGKTHFFRKNQWLVGDIVGIEKCVLVVHDELLVWLNLKSHAIHRCPLRNITRVVVGFDFVKIIALDKYDFTIAGDETRPIELCQVLEVLLTNADPAPPNADACGWSIGDGPLVEEYPQLTLKEAQKKLRLEAAAGLSVLPPRASAKPAKNDLYLSKRCTRTESGPDHDNHCFNGPLGSRRTGSVRLPAAFPAAALHHRLRR